MIRFYICAMESVPVPGGDGATYQRPAIARYAKATAEDSAPVWNWVSVQKAGGPAWVLVYADADDFTLVDADPDCRSVLENFTDFLQDGTRNPSGVRIFLAQRTWGSLTAQQRNRISTALTNRGVDVSGVTNGTTLYQLLELIGQRIDPAFKLASFGSRSLGRD